MQIIIGIIGILITVSIYKKYFYKKTEKLEGIEKFKQDLEKYYYLIKRNDYLTTPSEGRFLRRLNEYIKDKDYIVYTKVRIGDIIEVGSTKKGFRPYSITARLDRSHIDFVLLKKSTLTVFCAIELDDYTHKNEKAKEKDEIKNIIFDFVKIPLIRFNSTFLTDDDFRNSGII